MQGAISKDEDKNWDHEPGRGSKVAEPSRLWLFGLQQRCFCGETPQPLSSGSWEAACSFLNCSRAMNRGEIHHGDTEAQRYKRSVLFLRASVPLWCKPGSWEGNLSNERNA